jgi:hypothetical protein
MGWTRTVVQGPWGLRARWRLYLPFVAMAVAAAVVLVLVLRGSGSGREVLVVESAPTDPVALPSSSAPESNTPSPKPSPTASEPEPAAVVSRAPEPTTSAGPRLDVTEAALLSTGYVEHAFAQGRSALVQTVPRGLPVAYTCFDVEIGYDSTDPRPTGLVARTWSWPDEVVATEVIAEFASPDDAYHQYGSCQADPSPRWDPGISSSNGQYVDTQLQLGRYAFIKRIPREAASTAFSAVLIGPYVVYVNWRQSGGDVPLEPLEQALSAALSRASGGTEGAPVAAPTQQTEPGLAGYPTRATLPPGVVAGRQLDWIGDLPWEFSNTLYCGSAGLPTTAIPLFRQWRVATGRTTDTGIAVSASHAAEGTDASKEFGECRTSEEGAADVDGVGDEAFAVVHAAETWLYVRSASSYVVVLSDGAPDDLAACKALAADTLRTYDVS